VCHEASGPMPAGNQPHIHGRPLSSGPSGLRARRHPGPDPPS
jgi:hypothetical protein